MKLNLTKTPAGFECVEMDLDSLAKLKTGELYEVEIKQTRNPEFHRKVFAFLKFCFEHYESQNIFMSEREQFDAFRSDLTILAGYAVRYYTLDGKTRLEAKSLRYSAMNQQEFGRYYSSLINAALKHVFGTFDDESLNNRLLSFF